MHRPESINTFGSLKRGIKDALPKGVPFTIIVPGVYIAVLVHAQNGTIAV